MGVPTATGPVVAGITTGAVGGPGGARGGAAAAGATTHATPTAAVASGSTTRRSRPGPVGRMARRRTRTSQVSAGIRPREDPATAEPEQPAGRSWDCATIRGRNVTEM